MVLAAETKEETELQPAQMRPLGRQSAPTCQTGLRKRGRRAYFFD